MLPESTATSEDLGAPVIGARDICFTLPDPDDRFTRVRLYQEIRRPRPGPDLERVEGGWRLRWPRPAADRLEYNFVVTYQDGHNETMCDPGNSRRAGGPFGDKSVIEMPGYEAPDWTTALPGPQGNRSHTGIRSHNLRSEVPTTVWSSDGLEEGRPAPLLVVHDGPEYDRHAGLLGMLDRMIADRRLPPMRAALLAPLDRDRDYSASLAYGRALALDVLPALQELAPAPPGRRMRAGMGASLGALAMLHTHRRHPASFGGLFLQSGSFFRQRSDKQESGFSGFRRVTRFMGTVLSSHSWLHPIAVEMTCGGAEENRDNNRATREALAEQGYEVTGHELPDAHNWTAWRDALDPHLVGFLVRLWS